MIMKMLLKIRVAVKRDKNYNNDEDVEELQ